MDFREKKNAYEEREWEQTERDKLRENDQLSKILLEICSNNFFKENLLKKIKKEEEKISFYVSLLLGFTNM